MGALPSLNSNQLVLQQVPGEAEGSQAMLCTARHFSEPVVGEGCLSRDKQLGTHDRDASTPRDTQLSLFLPMKHANLLVLPTPQCHKP